MAKFTSSMQRAFTATFGTAGKMLSAVYLGNGVYRITYRDMTTFNPTTMVRVFRLDHGRLRSPTLAETKSARDAAEAQLPKHGAPPGTGTTGTDRNLDAVKEKWSLWLLEHKTQISPNEMAAFTRLIQGWTGTAESLQSSMSIASRNLDFGLTALIEGGLGGLTIGGLGAGGGGGGGRGGSFGPEYVKPDRRVIEDQVKGSMVSLVGTVLDDELDRIVDIFMSEDRRNFDTPNEQISPTQSALEAIRKTKDYRTVHKLRPASQDERTWISDRRQAAETGGLTTSAQEAFAITQATVGGDIEDVEEAAGFAQFQTSGRAPDPIQARIRSAALGLFQATRK